MSIVLLTALSVFACEPEWAALATELGGDKVNVYVATSAFQDVHRIDAKPSLVARARSADLVVATGAELEIGVGAEIHDQDAVRRFERPQRRCEGFGFRLGDRKLADDFERPVGELGRKG